MEIWGSDREDGSESELVKISKKDSFPFLDMAMFWKEEELNFRVYMKDKQQLKYLNNGSTHTNA